MSQSDLIGCDAFILTHGDGASLTPTPCENESETQLALQWEADTGLPPDQMPLLDTGRVGDSLSNLWYTLAGMSGNKPFIWAQRIAGRPLKKWEIDKLLNFGGCENYREKEAPVRKKKRGGFSKINEKKRELRDEKFWRVTAYILKSIRRGWRRNALTVPEVFKHACKAVFGTVEAFAHRGRMAVFRQRIFNAVMLCQAAVKKPVNNSENSAENCDTPKNDVSPITRVGSGTPTGVHDSLKVKTLGSCGVPPCDNAPPIDNRGAVADRQPTPLAPSPPSRVASGAGALFPENARAVPAKMVGLARSVLPALRDEISEMSRRDAGFERWALGWLAFWLRESRSRNALVSAAKNEISAGWRGGMLRERLQAAAARLHALPANWIERLASERSRRQYAKTSANAHDAKVADYRRRMEIERDPAMRALFRRALERLTGEFSPA